MRHRFKHVGGDRRRSRTAKPADSAVIEQPVRRRRPSTGRKRQEEIWKYEERERQREQEPHLTESELEDRANAALAEAQELDEYTIAGVEAVKPVLTAPSDVDRQVELAAIFRLPVFVWLRLWLGGCKYGPRGARRSFPVMIAFHVAFGIGRMHLSEWREQLRKANPFAAWQHLYPTDSGPDDESAFYKQIKRLLGPSRNWRVWAAANRDLVRELAGELIVVKRKNGTRTRFSKVPEGLSDEVCVVVVSDLGLCGGSPETGAPKGRAALATRRAAQEGTDHHEHDEEPPALRTGYRERPAAA